VTAAPESRTAGAPRPAPLAALQRSARESRPLAPVHAATHSRLHEIEPGRCVASIPGVVDDPDLGLWVLADFVTGLAVTGTIGVGERITTLRLTLQLLAPAASGPLHATSELVTAAGDDVALSHAVITDAAGRTVARGTARNAVLRDAAGDTFDDTPGTFTAEPRTASSGLLAVREDGEDLLARPDRASVNSAEVVQGGVLAALAGRALQRALGPRPDEVTATFLRATAPDADVRAAAVVEHAGRRLRSGRVTLTDVRGKPVLTASGLAYAAGTACS
jgi:acyl-coenzyme A thioesterase PaaI-like protein